MKVLHISHAFFPEGSGGVESYVRRIAGRQRAEGLEVQLLTGSLSVRPAVEVVRCDHEGLPVWRVHRDDLFFDHFAKLWHPGVERVVRRLLRAERPDLVHVHHWIRLTGNLVEIACDAGVPAAVTLHDVLASCPRCFRVHRDGSACSRPLGVTSCLPCVPRFGHESAQELEFSIRAFADQLRAELETARAVIVADAATGRLLEATAGFPAERCAVLPMPSGAGPGIGRPPAPGGGALRIGHWGWLAPHKGVVDLVRAVGRLTAEDPSRPVELHLFGPFAGDVFDREVRELVRDLPVTCHGPFVLEDIARADLHVAAFPSRAFETWSFVLDEALELGLPVVVSEFGAPASRAGDAALRVPPGDDGALAQALRRIRDDGDLRARMRAASRPASLTPDEHVAALREIYATAIAAGAPATPTRVDPLDRAELLRLQRESALARICPEQGPH